MFWPFRLPATYFGLICSIWSLIAVLGASVVSALRTRRGQNRGAWPWLLLMLPLAVLVAGAYLRPFSRLSGFRLFSVPSSAMQNTIMQGDHIWVDTWAFRQDRPKRNDVVLLRSDGLWQVKRVSACGGEVIQSRQDVISIDGTPQVESFAIHTRDIESNPELHDFLPVNIPKGKLFVMGDNRDVSFDSRTAEFGLVDESAVRGRVLFVVRGRSLTDRDGLPIR